MVRFAHDASGTPARAWRAHPAWAGLPDLDLDGVDRLVVLAAHPDDETLGAGALVATAHDLGLPVSVVVATAGERSHPASPTHEPARLAARRRAEVARAAEVLAPGAEVTLLDLPDGDLATHEEHVVAVLVPLVGDGRGVLLVAPWRHDGHPDHEAAGRAASTTAARTGARLLEHPVWAWHWGDPARAPWERLVALRVAPEEAAVKAEAVRAHRTQVQPLSGAPGDEVLLGPDLLAHFAGDREVFVAEPVVDDALDRLHAERPDPWGVDSRWYERRRRDLLLAVLPRERWGRVLELGCSTGALTEALAGRCDELVALDASAHAVEAARGRLAPHPHVRVERAVLPDDWPGGRSDLVVVSEVGYFLSPAGLDGLVERLRDALADDGVVLAAHWRHEVVGWPLDGAAVHARLRDGLPGRDVVAQYRDRDVEVLLLGGPSTLPDPTA